MSSLAAVLLYFFISFKSYHSDFRLLHVSVRHLRPQLLRVPRGLLRDVIRPPRRPHHHHVRVHAHQALGLQLLQDIQVSPPP
jgi:hypothetical protein